MKFLVDHGVNVDMLDNPLWEILMEDDAELAKLAEQNNIYDCYDAKEKGARILERYLKGAPVSRRENEFCRKFLSIKLSDAQSCKVALLSSANLFAKVRISIHKQLAEARACYIEAVDGLRRKIKLTIDEIRLGEKKPTISDREFISKVHNLINLSGMGATMQNPYGRVESYCILSVELVKLISEEDSIKSLSKFPILSADLMSLIKISSQYSLIRKTCEEG